MLGSKGYSSGHKNGWVGLLEEDLNELAIKSAGYCEAALTTSRGFRWGLGRAGTYVQN